MTSKGQVILSARQVELNEILTVSTHSIIFDSHNYMITDETGRLMRKGTIMHGTREFKLCIAGFKTGVYSLSIGQSIEKFTVL